MWRGMEGPALLAEVPWRFTSNYTNVTADPLFLAEKRSADNMEDCFFRDQFARCPWVHVSQDGEQCENGNPVFCLPYGLLAAVLLLAALMVLQIHESKRGPQEENAGEVDLKETLRSNGAMGHTQNVLSEHGDL